MLLFTMFFCFQSLCLSTSHCGGDSPLDEPCQIQNRHAIGQIQIQATARVRLMEHALLLRPNRWTRNTNVKIQNADVQAIQVLLPDVDRDVILQVAETCGDADGALALLLGMEPGGDSHPAACAASPPETMESPAESELETDEVVYDAFHAVLEPSECSENFAQLELSLESRPQTPRLVDGTPDLVESDAEETASPRLVGESSILKVESDTEETPWLPVLTRSVPKTCLGGSDTQARRSLYELQTRRMQLALSGKPAKPAEPVNGG